MMPAAITTEANKLVHHALKQLAERCQFVGSPAYVRWNYFGLSRLT
jgi:hypothetical protein